MKKLFLALFIVSAFSTASSQLQNQNMYLLRNLNEHPSSTLYSAIWGY